MKSEIVLIRHGITEGNEKKMYYGSTDVPLSARGERQLKKQAESGMYPERAEAQYFTSGMLRTEQTFEIIYGDKPHGVIEELRELDFGEFEMHTYEELNCRPEYQEWIAAEGGAVPPPGGESIEDFKARVVRGFEKLKVQNELLMLKLRNHGKEAVTVCVCHGGVISGIMNHIWPDEYDNFYGWIPNPGYGYILEIEDGSVTGYRKFTEEKMKIKNTVTELIGGTPMLRLNKMAALFGLPNETRLIAKLESFNPAGSAKDRVGYNMIIEAEKSGKLKPGGTIIEPTSGNTGVGIAMVCAARGYKAVMVMPESMSVERRTLLKALGAELVLTPASEGMAGSVAKAEALAAETPGSIIAGQFENPANPKAHYLTTGPEIWEDTDGEVDVFVSAFGTGGTVSGTGRFLKEKNPEVKTIAIEPASSPLVTQGKAGPHKIQGIGANFVPENFDASVVDEVITVTDEDALETMKKLATVEGLLCGVSSGAAVYGAAHIAARPENRGKTIVVLLPDTGERYLSIF